MWIKIKWSPKLSLFLSVKIQHFLFFMWLIFFFSVIHSFLSFLNPFAVYTCFILSFFSLLSFTILLFHFLFICFFFFYISLSLSYISFSFLFNFVCLSLLSIPLFNHFLLLSILLILFISFKIRAFYRFLWQLFFFVLVFCQMFQMRERKGKGERKKGENAGKNAFYCINSLFIHSYKQLSRSGLSIFQLYIAVLFVTEYNSKLISDKERYRSKNSINLLSCYC